ncbi:MAG TPA: hypothetical protein VF041_09525 [Gemmatimonadaceae bacterium]
MRRALSLVALLACVACDKSGLGRGGRASATDSIATLNTQLAQVTQASAQQDSLMQGFTETTKLLDDIDQELSKVKGLKSHVPLDVKGEGASDPKAAYRASLLGKVQEVTQLLRANRNRVAELSARNKAQGGKLAQYEQTIASLEAISERQKQEIAELTGRVDSLTLANSTLASEKSAIADTANALRRDLNTVYYIVGTKKDLMARGIVVEEGSKFLFFGHKALVPSRKLDPSAFTAMDRFANTPIALHTTDRAYKIVSRQNPALIEEEKTADGKPTGTLRVTDPVQFWGPSKYLIIVEG